MRRLGFAAVLTLAALAACGREASTPTDQESALTVEADLAVSLSGSADSAAQRQGTTLDRLLAAFHAQLRLSDDPRARALLADSRALADSGRTAARAGDRAAARTYFEAAHEKLFRAIVLVMPGAAERIGAAVDTIRGRMLLRLDTNPAPRIRQVLTFVGTLRTNADAALAASQPWRALALNVRAMETLRTLRAHLQRPGGNGLPGDQGANPPPPTPPDLQLP